MYVCVCVCVCVWWYLGGVLVGGGLAINMFFMPIISAALYVNIPEIVY